MGPGAKGGKQMLGKQTKEYRDNYLIINCNMCYEDNSGG